METSSLLSPSKGIVSFKSLKSIDKVAYKNAGKELNEIKPDLIELSKDVDVEIFGKNGFFTKIKSIIVFVTEIGKDKGEWSSIQIDPKGYMPTEHRYKSVQSFTAENIKQGLIQAKQRLLKRNPELPKPSLPTDTVLLKPIVEKFVKSCKI